MRWKLLLILLCSTQANAFPEMIGHGYNSCKPCHYDSSGGGPLTEYGHTIAEEILSIWSFRGEGETLYGYDNVAPLFVAGDFRSLFHHYQDRTVSIDQSFPMQREMSIGIDPSKNVSLIASAGLYGPDAKEFEYRRYYARFSFDKGLGVRAGRFMPAFGVMQQDHTKAVRELFGEGKESVNLEVSFTHRRFELFLTKIAGSVESRPRLHERSGYASKLSMFLTRGVHVGASYAALADDTALAADYVAYDIFAGNDKIWALAEYQTSSNLDRKLYAHVGFAPLHGLWVKVELDWTHFGGSEVFCTLQVFPRPHYQVVLSASQKQYFMIAHYYL